MNLSLDNLRELLENFLQNTGGRRGRERERLRQQRADAAGGAVAGTAPESGAAAATADPGGDADAAAGTAQAAGGAATTGAGPTFDQERPDPDELDEEEVVDDLYHRIETLEDELERNGSRLGSILDAQEQVAEEVEGVNDTVRQLLGIYDRLTNSVNPFTGEGEAEEGFGVFGEEAPEEGFGIESSASVEGDETVSFEDLKAVVEEAVDDDGEGSGPQKITFDEDDVDDADDADDKRVEVQATDRVDDGGDAADADEDGSGDERDVTLESLATTYASDVLVFEWLTELVRTAGPSATLRAISYYHEIGWIEREVKEHLEAVLSGPDLDIHVDPETTPRELTAEDHADSYTYIMKLNEVHETRGEVDS